MYVAKIAAYNNLADSPELNKDNVPSYYTTAQNVTYESSDGTIKVDVYNRGDS